MSSDIKRVINSPQNSDTWHVVIGHYQINNCWDIVLGSEELNFPINWICKVSRGTPDQFIEIIREEIATSTIPLKITAVI